MPVEITIKLLRQARTRVGESAKKSAGESGMRGLRGLEKLGEVGLSWPVESALSTFFVFVFVKFVFGIRQLCSTFFGKGSVELGRLVGGLMVLFFWRPRVALLGVGAEF